MTQATTMAFTTLIKMTKMMPKLLKIDLIKNTMKVTISERENPIKMGLKTLTQKRKLGQKDQPMKKIMKGTSTLMVTTKTETGKIITVIMMTKGTLMTRGEVVRIGLELIEGIITQKLSHRSL